MKLRSQSQYTPTYSVLQVQMEPDHKITITTNKCNLRKYTPLRIDPQLVDSGQFFYYSPQKTPTPLHQITLKKGNKKINIKQNRVLPFNGFKTQFMIQQKIELARLKSATSIHNQRTTQQGFFRSPKYKLLGINI